MNIIDKKFYNLINLIQNQTLEEVYTEIKNNFFNINQNIKNSLEDFLNKFPYWGELKQKENNYEELYNRAESLKKHLEDYVWLYQKLSDYRSKKLLFAILNNLYKFDFTTLNTSKEQNYLHYFDIDLVKCNENEVIVDLGSYTGDSIIDYFNTYGTDQYKKIYCYEITDESFNSLKNNLAHYPNIEFRKKAVSDKEETLYIKRNDVDDSANLITNNGDETIEATTLDEDIKENITLLKMDIEGSEQKAIIGAKKHIQNEHPKLLISVYHNHEDLWKIPKMINEITPNYNFYLRYYGNNIFPTEIVLIASK